MKKYSQKEALEEIFYNNSTPLSKVLIVQKSRFKKGELHEKAIQALLEHNNFVIARTPLYKKEDNQVNYFRHVEKTEYIKIDLSLKDFEEIFKRKVFEITLPKTDEWIEVILQDNKFVRGTCKDKPEWYMDITIKDIKITSKFHIALREIIDYNKPR